MVPARSIPILLAEALVLSLVATLFGVAVVLGLLLTACAGSDGEPAADQTAPTDSAGRSP